MKKPVTIYLLTCLLIIPAILSAQPESQVADAQSSSVSAGKVSLDMKGMDIVDVLKILAMRGNLNIVAGKNVRGKVTLFLKNVEVIDALEIILAANDLAYEKQGEIINVMSERDYELLYGEKSYDKKIAKIIRLEFAKAVEVSKALNQIKSKIGKVIVDQSSNTLVLMDVPDKIKQMEAAVKSMDLATTTETFTLNFAQAKDVAEKISESLTKNLGQVKVDERMNKLIITDLPERIEYISRVIDDFDEKDMVVLIEAKIIQLTLNKDLGYGVNWNNVFAGIDTIARSDLSINLAGVTEDTTFTYTRAHGATEYGDQVILRLLDTLGKANVLSTPRIVVSNNEEAKVLIGTREAYVTSTVTQTDGTTTTADNVEFVNVGVSLAVTPTISRDGYISMKIKPEVSSAPTTLELTNPDGSVRTSVPIVTTSEAETQLMVKDGTTIIMAGLMKDTRKDNTERLPFLADIPIIGHVFQSRGQEDEKIELVIFLTPTIISEDDDFEGEMIPYLDDHQQTGVDAEAEPDQLALNTKKDDQLIWLEPELESADLDLELSKITAEPIGFYGNFREYCDYLTDEIEQQLQQNTPRQIKRQEAELSFVLAYDGSLQGRPEILSFVDQEVEDLIVQSVSGAAPFSPFPKDYLQDQETFILSVEFGN
ncbi:secretin N-terminal domain-containing protein [Candidatus Omnitrophota bacterium]